jgi:hypothetical protein
MADSNTSLYPIKPNTNSEDAVGMEFFIKSENVKVFPSAWRGAEFETSTETTTSENVHIIDNKKQFNPESVLNTEYNITRTAGGLKTFIESATKVDNLCNFKFFINGYSFEVFNLDLTRYIPNNEEPKISDEPIDLFAYIRVGDLKLGSADLDDTKVLMPFSWTAISTPIPLDAKLEDAYLIDATNATQWDKLSFLYGGINPEKLAEAKDTYVFTGLMFTTDAQANYATEGSNYFKIQLIKNGELCNNNFWPTGIKGSLDGTAIVIDSEDTLIADVADMLALGKYNTTTNADEKTYIAIGNGNSDSKRRNAFEVTAQAADEDIYSHTIHLGKLKVKYDNQLEAEQKGGVITDLYTINNRFEVSSDGTSITLNKPASTIDFENHRNTNMGAHIYGNIDIIGDARYKGSQLRFKDASYDEQSQTWTENTIAMAQIVPVATGASNVINEAARGLKVTNVHEINEEALVFQPCTAGAIRNNLRGINKGIRIDEETGFNHSIHIGNSENHNAANIIGAGTNKLVLKHVQTNTGSKNHISNVDYLNHMEITTDGTKDIIANITKIKNNDNSITLNDSDGIVLDGNVTIKGTSKFIGKIDTATCADEQNGLRRYICDLIYPVGSIYICMDAIGENGNSLTTISNLDDVKNPKTNKSHPNNRFGGKWNLTSEGRMLLGAGIATTGDSVTAQRIFSPISVYDVRTKGGYYNVQLPTHTHAVKSEDGGSWVKKDGGEACPITINTETATAVNSSNINDDSQLVIKHEKDASHCHSIPVTTLSHHEHDENGYYTDPMSFSTWSSATPKYRPGHSYSYTGHYYEEPRDTIEKRIKYMFKDKGQQTIPAVSMGTWYPDYNCSTWNAPGPVYTGYQYVTNAQGAPFTSFSAWQSACATAFKDWFGTLGEEDGTSSKFFWSSGRWWSDGCDDDDDEFKLWWSDTNVSAGLVNDYAKISSTYINKGKPEGIFQITLDDGTTTIQLREVQGLLCGWGTDGPNTTYDNREIEINKIRDYFIIDWINAFCRGDKTNSIWKMNGDKSKQFTFRQDDGAHKHADHKIDTAVLEHSHKVIISEIASHTHNITIDAPDTTEIKIDPDTGASTGTLAQYAKIVKDCSYTNLPPYQACFIWQRVPETWDWDETDKTYKEPAK